MRCAVRNCGSDNGGKTSDCSFFIFPTDEALAQKWKQFCRQPKDIDITTSYICMYHFIREDFENGLKYEMGFSKKLYLKRDAVPTIYDRNLHTPKRQRLEQRALTNIVKEEELLQEQDELSITSQDTTPYEDGSSLEGTVMYEYETLFENPAVLGGTDPFQEVMINVEPANCLKTELENLHRENLKLREENRKYRRLFTALERDYKKQAEEYTTNLKVLEDRALKAENQCKNMESRLKKILKKPD
ncbi:52 kDa repressor of the inhibitor of the protein kinase-like [Anastrepha obliqua]|uniref:52 kDa repressor of the inhibitor of the protein kinase-like n=1 Tax=Anastrepha obliqua TaxID=95512 RepID=UPI00240A1811|nr:52 kDa repressor of the inhibitor of the protein kinase-like [Anastrepha obliqua]